MNKDEIELIEINKEIASAGNLEWSIIIESMILNTYREALKQGQELPTHNISIDRDQLKNINEEKKSKIRTDIVAEFIEHCNNEGMNISDEMFETFFGA